jgi:hydroxypyruvate isomerase
MRASADAPRCPAARTSFAPDQDRARHRAVYLHTLAYAAKEAASAGITLVLEPINTRDMPGFFLNRQDEAHAVCAEVGAPNLKVQMDLYHCQIVEGDLAMRLTRHLDRKSVV